MTTAAALRRELDYAEAALAGATAEADRATRRAEHADATRGVAYQRQADAARERMAKQTARIANIRQAIEDEPKQMEEQ